MPIYEYQCEDCLARFEIIRPMKDADADMDCIKCQSNHVKRLISRFNAAGNGRAIIGASNCAGCSSGSCSTCGSH
jgi:putative FmdB family regulatory protein